MTTITLAPLRGLTDAIYRNTSARHFTGFDSSVAPFLSTFQGTKVKSAQLDDLLPENNPSMPVVPQILGKHPDQFTVLADMLFDLGYDTINWNLGCPYPMVANKQRGSGLLPHPDKIETFLDYIQKMNGSLSIKTRIGRHSPEEIAVLIDIFNRFPLTELIIHPRLGVQMYKGHPDLDVFEHCFAQSVHPVTYNGDINTLNDFKRLQARFPTVNRWMIGRGALANPFLAEQIKGEFNPKNQVQRLQNFHDDLFNHYQERLQGPGHLLGRMKGVWYHLKDRLIKSKKHLKKIQKTRNVDNYKQLISTLFRKEQLWKVETND